MASNRSPSPFSTRNFRNSETNSAIRRSFNGSPFARPSSPATTDRTKRHSIGRERFGNSKFHDEKENHKAAKVHSPAKNFMSPTISAASKFTPSPRKRVLGDKNELTTRTSIQFLDNHKHSPCTKDLDLKFDTTPFSLTKMDEGYLTILDQNLVFETPPVHEVTSDMVSQVRTISDCVNVVEPGPKTSPIVAPLHDDISHRPYDPKKNFLSPRPQFLHYKPNPRIEVFLNKLVKGDEEGVSRLEDSFNLPENLSDTTNVTEEEEESEVPISTLVADDESEEKALKPELEDSFNLSENLSDTTNVTEEEEESEVPISTLVADDEFEEKALKPPFFNRSKAVSFLLLVSVIACFSSVSFTESPHLNFSTFKDVGFNEISRESFEFAAFAKEVFDDFAENLKQWWSTDSVYYLSRFSSTNHKITSIQFFNLTTGPYDESLFDGYIETDYESQYFDLGEFEEEEDNETETVEGEAYKELEVDNDFETEETAEIEPNDDDSLQVNFNGDDESSEVPPNPVSKPEIKPVIEVATLKTESDVAEVSSETITQTEILDWLFTKPINTFSEQTIAISFAGLSFVVAALVIIYTIKRKPIAETTMTHVNEPSALTKKQISKQEAWETESCPSETSSSFKRSSRTRANEAQSQATKPRNNNNKRESLASSLDLSMDSPSFGSFTTLERIPIKHGDEEIVTPIRRSSRLRKNQVVSS